MGHLTENNAKSGQAALKGMSFELDSFLGRPCDWPGCARKSTYPSVSLSPLVSEPI